MRRLPFVRHRPVSKLRYKYRACRHPVAKPRWHALWLLARADVPRTPAEVADVVGLTGPSWGVTPADFAAQATACS